ncbi:MAG: chromosome segregation protein SMC [Planctomycetota bacterium]|nr:chromosome segregation protein SMC [Planctomycetota bacterium]
MLKSLELFGFKSFADRTRFDFSRGITCVVGPNGSGKSNVVDAMKWILGDQSPKSLRGKDMTDVIFNGSANRKASAFAEATLAFDNSQRMLPIEADEVTIGRRLWTNGDSEYLINGATARLKDIKESFMGTGASTSAYSIIEQGRVSEILQSNPQARRLIFEEAAGISRFRSRKTEALRKLERVSQNLLRLQDIVDQFESQLNSTRNQATKAAKFREVSKELQSAWFGLAADDYRWMSARLSSLDSKLGATQAEIDELTEQQQAVELRLSSFDEELAVVDDGLRKAEREAGTTREAIVSQEATIRHETARLRESETEIVRLRSQRATTLARLGVVNKELAEAQAELDQFDETFKAQQQEVEAHEAHADQLAVRYKQSRSRIDERQAERSQLSEQASQVRQQIALLEAQLVALNETHEKTIEQRDRLKSELRAAEVELATRQTSLDEVLEQASELGDALKEVRAKRKKLIADQEAEQEVLVEIRERRSASQARLTVLEDLEVKQEGIGIGVREILQRAKTSDFPPWNGIVGSVADLLDVDLENAALLEVALGNRAQLIVMHDLDPMIDYLKRGSARIDGRVGFLGLDEVATSEDAESQKEDVDLSGDVDVIFRADQLVSASCQHPKLATRLLDQTWVVTDLDAANRLAVTEGVGHRFVTLQGELIDPDGTLYAGTVRGEASVLSRKSELRRLKNDLVRMSQQMATSEARIKAFAKQSVDIEAELSAAVEQREDVNGQLTQRRSEFESQQRVMTRLSEQHAAVEEVFIATTEQMAESQSELAQSFDALNEIEKTQNEANDEVARLEGELIEIEQERNKLLQEQTEARLKLARAGERHENLISACSRLSDETAALNDQIEDSTRRLDTFKERRRTSVLGILNANGSLAELAIKAESSADAVDRLSREKDQLRQVRSGLVEEETAFRRQRRAIADRQHEEEIEARDMRHRLSTYGERIEEEYGQTLEEVVDSGASAFRDHLIERGLIADPDVQDETEEGDQEVVDDEPLDAEDDESTDEEFEEDSDENDDLDEEEWDDDESEENNSENDDENEEASHEDFVGDAVEDQDVDAEDESVDTDPAAEVAESFAEEEVHLTLQEIEGTRYEDVREELEENVNRLRRRLKTMGNVNTDALKDLDDLEEKFNHFNSQLMDLTEAKTTLEEIIRKINAESRRLFLESFTRIQVEFRELFRKLFGGGDGDLILEDPDDVLDCGIDIVARPPGKELRSISLLSGGEKTMTAVAMLLAIFKSNPSPFCILDEVDAALDDANVERYAGVVHEFKEMTQFIMISHRKRTMTVADVIFGVTMEQSGVSKRLTISFEDVGEDGEFRVNGGAEAA